MGPKHKNARSRYNVMRDAKLSQLSVTFMKPALILLE